MAVQEPGDGWWDQTSEVAGAVWDDLKSLEFCGFTSSSACFQFPLEAHRLIVFALQYVEFIAPQAVPFLWHTMKWAL